MDHQEAAAWLDLEAKCPGLVSWTTLALARVTVVKAA